MINACENYPANGSTIYATEPLTDTDGKIINPQDEFIVRHSMHIDKGYLVAQKKNDPSQIPYRIWKGDLNKIEERTPSTVIIIKTKLKNTFFKAKKKSKKYLLCFFEPE